MVSHGCPGGNEAVDLGDRIFVSLPPACLVVEYCVDEDGDGLQYAVEMRSWSL